MFQSPEEVYGSKVQYELPAPDRYLLSDDHHAVSELPGKKQDGVGRMGVAELPVGEIVREGVREKGGGGGEVPISPAVVSPVWIEEERGRRIERL